MFLPHVKQNQSHISIRHDLGLVRWLIAEAAWHQYWNDVTLSYCANLVKYSVKKLHVKQSVRQKHCIISGFRKKGKKINMIYSSRCIKAVSGNV